MFLSKYGAIYRAWHCHSDQIPRRSRLILAVAAVLYADVA
jgi:hypothetical protein